jgi:glycosyltransferase involved in cell wall biosynthesis
MHICFFSAEHHSEVGGGGAESYVNTMAQALTGIGHQVSVIAFGKHNEQRFDERVRVIKSSARNWHWYLYRGLPLGKSFAQPVREIEWSQCAWSALEKLNKANPVDVVETGEMIVLQQLVPGKKPPMVVRGHGNRLAIKRFTRSHVGLGDLFGRKLELMGVRRAAAITAVSAFQAKELAQDLSLPEKSIHVIPNPVSPILLQRALGQTRVEPAKPVVLYTGRIEMNKGSLELLRSVDRVASRFPDVEYVIAGARHNSIDDQMLNSALGVNGTHKHVRMLGHVPWQQLADLYRRASVFVMPSFYETFGISVIEAMAFGLPVVATKTGGLPEVVEDGITGILVPTGDAEALADALIRLLRDPDLRQRMGQAGQERVRAEFTIDRIVSQTLAVYESVAFQNRER